MRRKEAVLAVVCSIAMGLCRPETEGRLQKSLTTLCLYIGNGKGVFGLRLECNSSVARGVERCFASDLREMVLGEHPRCKVSASNLYRDL